MNEPSDKRFSENIELFYLLLIQKKKVATYLLNRRRTTHMMTNISMSLN